jgi:hypothetical protein
VLTFLNPKTRKAAYNVFAVMNAVVVALVPVAIQFGFIPADWSENIIQTAAGVLSVAGFMLASKNVDTKPVETIPQEGLVIEAGQQGPIVAEVK